MVTLTEPRHPAEFLLSEANGHRSRDTIVLASNGTTPIVYEAGTVLARLTTGGKFVLYDNAGTDGTEVAAAILLDGVTVPATGDARAVAILRDAEVVGDSLVYDPALSGGTLTTARAAAATDFAALGIIVR